VGPTWDRRVKPDLTAMGVGVVTARARSRNQYARANGTSFSTPLVAAAAAFVLDAHPDWTVTRVRSALIKTASDYVANGTHDPLFVRGYGILDVMAAISFIFPTGDADADGDKDLKDFAKLQACFRGPRGTAPPGCDLVDLDGDEDIDGADYRLFQPTLDGPQ